MYTGGTVTSRFDISTTIPPLPSPSLSITPPHPLGRPSPSASQRLYKSSLVCSFLPACMFSLPPSFAFICLFLICPEKQCILYLRRVVLGVSGSPRSESAECDGSRRAVRFRQSHRSEGPAASSEGPTDRKFCLMSAFIVCLQVIVREKEC